MKQFNSAQTLIMSLDRRLVDFWSNVNFVIKERSIHNAVIFFDLLFNNNNNTFYYTFYVLKVLHAFKRGTFFFFFCYSLNLSSANVQPKYLRRGTSENDNMLIPVKACHHFA